MNEHNSTITIIVFPTHAKYFLPHLYSTNNATGAVITLDKLLLSSLSMGGSETTKTPLVLSAVLHGSWSLQCACQCAYRHCYVRLHKPWILIYTNKNTFLNLFRSQNNADYCLATPSKLPCKSELQVKWCTSPVSELQSFIQMCTRSAIKLTDSKLWPEQQGPWVDQGKWYQAEPQGWDLVACNPLKSRKRWK